MRPCLGIDGPWRDYLSFRQTGLSVLSGEQILFGYAPRDASHQASEAAADSRDRVPDLRHQGQRRLSRPLGRSPMERALDASSRSASGGSSRYSRLFHHPAPGAVGSGPLAPENRLGGIPKKMPSPQCPPLTSGHLISCLADSNRYFRIPHLAFRTMIPACLIFSTKQPSLTGRQPTGKLLRRRARRLIGFCESVGSSR